MGHRSPGVILPLLLIVSQALAPETQAAPPFAVPTTVPATVSKVPLICIDRTANLADTKAAGWLTSCADAAKELLYGRKSIDPSTTDATEGFKGEVKAHLLGVYQGSIPTPSRATLDPNALSEASPVPVCVARMGTLLKELAAAQSNPSVGNTGKETTNNMIGHRCGDWLSFRFSFDDIDVTRLIPLRVEIENPTLRILQDYRNNPTKVSSTTSTRGYYEVSRTNGLYAYAVDQTWKEFEAEVLANQGFSLSAGYESLSTSVAAQLVRLNALWEDPDLEEQLLECGSQATDALRANTDASGRVTSYQRGAFQRQRAELACASWMAMRGTIFKLAQLEFYNRVKERMQRVGITPVADLRTRVMTACTPLQTDGTLSTRKMEEMQGELESACGPMRRWRRDEKQDCLENKISRMINGSSNGSNSCYLPVVNQYFEEQYAKLEN